MSYTSGLRKISVEDACEQVSVGIVIQPAQYYTDAASGVKAFRSANIGIGRINDRDWVYISQEGHKKNRKSELKAGDVLVVRSGAPGTSCVVTNEFAGSNCIDIVFARPKKHIVLPEYLSLFTNSEIGKRQIAATQGGLALKHFNVGAFKKMIIDIPGTKEQATITSLLSSWDLAIEKAERLIAVKEKQKTILMQLLLTGNRRIKGFEKTWSEFYLGDLFKERSERASDHLPLVSITRENGIIPRNEDRKDTSSEDKSNYLRICPGDIGYNTMRMWQGVSALSSLEGIVSPAYTICTPKKGVDGEFMAYLFKLPRIINLFYRHSQGLTSDTWNLKYHHFQEIKVTVPEIEEQKAIARVLKGCDEEIDLLKKQADAYRRQKRGLMQKLLTGEWRVRVGGDENGHSTD